MDYNRAVSDGATRWSTSCSLRACHVMKLHGFCRSLGLLVLALATAVPTVAAHSQERTLAELPALSAERDWPWWRGPGRMGHASATKLPVKLSGEAGYRWKTPVPGRGHSSPVVVGERIFLTTADEKEQIQSVVALARDDGKLLWQTPISRGGFPEKNHPKNTEATPTVACDGARVFAVFWHHEAIHITALDLEGRVLWEKNLGHFRPRRYEFGYAPSPLIYRDTVIVSAEYDGESFIVAIAREDGSPSWRIDRPNNVSYSSPVVARVAGRDQLLISGADEVTSYDPATGKKLWSVAGTTAATAGTVVWEGDIVVASGGYPDAETIAIRADGQGEVLWRNKRQCYEQSLLTHNGYVYAFTDQGILYCWRLQDGHEMWRERLQGPVSASPVYAAGHIYWANERGRMYVFAANPERLDMVSEGQVGDEAFASPAIAGDEIFLRVAETKEGQRQEYVYCFGPDR